MILFYLLSFDLPFLLFHMYYLHLCSYRKGYSVHSLCWWAFCSISCMFSRCTLRTANHILTDISTMTVHVVHMSITHLSTSPTHLFLNLLFRNAKANLKTWKMFCLEKATATYKEEKSICSSLIHLCPKTSPLTQ